MDAIALLTGDHNRVRGLFAQFKTAHEAEDAKRMTTCAAKILEELQAHTTIEEEIFYPRARELSEEIEETVAEGIEEHHVVKVLIEEVQQLEAGSEEWVAKMTVMIENVEHHADEEEQELFPSIRSATDNTLLEELGQALEQRKDDLGAPTPSQAIELPKQTLAQLASEQEIPGRSSMDNDELAAAVDARGVQV